MSKWQRVLLTVLLMAEVAVTLLPVVRGLLVEPSPTDVPPGGRVRPVFQERDAPVGQPPGISQGVLLGTTMLLLVTAASALAPVWLRPRARTWVATFTGTHVAAAGLGWVHSLPLLTLLAAVSAVGVPLLVLAPPRRGE
ncbi:hypothetical protein ALI22I_33280 [Saccharothrix sp. ALI-22-I]|uniref:hypothetical protein n=1 Tax=Saccharothrix sp. ALI-22-I TaxID=1933778 RepID=UPI00097C7D7D|nr:hypothetical protein [Saccharothrix sp. ALI-22-I]ONI83394.1 hypothetical protein ALI22I_33280 [Saccharothrix sp. ALI-22-I]